MKKILSRWKLGITVFGRWLLFTLALGLVCWPLNFLKLIIPNSILNSEIYIIIAGVVYILLIFPLAFYFTAQWSGILQEEDEKTFREIKKKKAEKREAEPSARGDGIPPPQP